MVTVESEIYIRNGQLLVSLTGEVSPGELEQHFAQILDECAVHTQRRVFIDVRSALIACGRLVDTYNAFARMAEIYRHFMIRTGLYELRIVAVVPAANLETLKFGETVAVNRGLPLLITDDARAADHWLHT